MNTEDRSSKSLGISDCPARRLRRAEWFLPCVRGVFAATVMSLLGASLLWAAEGQYTQRGGSNRAGQYDNEVFLTPENVNSAFFGSLFSYNVDGAVVAQPLYVPNVNISGVGTV